MMGIPTDLKNLLMAYERRILALEEELKDLREEVRTKPKTTRKSSS